MWTLVLLPTVSTVSLLRSIRPSGRLLRDDHPFIDLTSVRRGKPSGWTKTIDMDL
jgi:hypothetical protein